MNIERVLMAAEFATRAHGAQVRKYTNEPYMVHPFSVAQTVRRAGGHEDMVIAAILHDVVEDCPKVKPTEIEDLFGRPVLALVMEVTKVSHGSNASRPARVALDNAHYARASRDGQTIKLADLIDNTRTIVYHDNGFAKVYMAEKRDLLAIMNKGTPVLYSEAKRMVDEYFAIEARRGH